MPSDSSSSALSSVGAIFDWDGVIIDSHDQHEKSWFMLADELGRPMTHELFKESFGRRNEQIIPGLFKWAEAGDEMRIRELGDRKEELYRRLIRGDGIEALPGVAELLSELGEADVMAVVVLKEGRTLTAAELIAHCEPRMARFMLPRYIEFQSALPKTETHRVQKRVLKDNGVGPATWGREAK